MQIDHYRPHAFRVHSVTPATIDSVIEDALRKVRLRAKHAAGLLAYGVHKADNGQRIVTLETWQNKTEFRAHAASGDGAILYGWAATGGRDPTPVDDADASVIVIDTFAVWRPLLSPISKFNIRNGEAFNRAPGCISTTVLRGIGAGSIATYARWRSVDDFAAAFSSSTGRTVYDTDGVNKAASAMTFGMIRPDYHSYTLVAHEES